MTAFLQQVAKALLAEHGAALRDVAVVLPSQRAGLYLRKWVSEEAGQPLWSPQIFTIGTFMEELSGLRPLAPEELLFEGYEAYRMVEGEKAQTFGDFLQWAGTTLADISEADAHLVPLESYYRDLRSWEEIEWTFNDNPLSQGQQRMVRFWAMVGKLHAALNARLLEQMTGTTGLIERTAAASASEVKNQWNAVWFAGLNALTPAQETVLRHFQSTGSASSTSNAALSKFPFIFLIIPPPCFSFLENALACFFPVFNEGCQTFIGQRMIVKLANNIRRAGCHMGTQTCCLQQVDRVADGSDQHFGVEIRIVIVNGQNVGDQLHAIERDIVKAPHER